MSSSRDDRYYASLGKSGKSPSLGDQGTGLFQTGQGGRTVLPPISSAFPTSHFPAPVTSYSNSYTQPRSSPARYDYSPAVYNSWTNAHNQPPTQMSSYGYYETHDNRYSAQPQSYYPSYSSRTSPSLPDNSTDSRKLPPLSTSSPERWTAGQYPTVSTNVPNASGIRSPTASYPPSYAPYPSTGAATGYPYGVPMTDVQSQAQATHQNDPAMLGADVRSSPPYSHGTTQMPPNSYTPPPVSPTMSDEPTIKKKRKRADATQLKLLNETYARTAFPSTEERQALAKHLDMSARSVQIWFQNKRQSMRQTRQTSSSAGAHQSFALSSQGDSLTEDSVPSSGGYDTMTGASYVPRSSQESHSSPSLSPASHRRGLAQDAAVVDPHKQQQWSRGY